MCHKASHCSPGDWSCQTIPVGCVIELTVEYVRALTEEHRRVVLGVCLCAYAFFIYM